MKVIYMSMIEQTLTIYYGKKELPKFVKIAGEGNTADADGLSYKQYIWIEDKKDYPVLFHELAHYLEWLYKEIDCEQESEFKAYIMGYIMGECFNQWRNY